MLNRSGAITGLTNVREGKLVPGLDFQMQSMESVTIYVSAFDVTTTTAHVIETLDKSISPGIGYAVTVGSVAQWIRRRGNDPGT